MHGDTDVGDKNNKTPLHWASSEGHKKIVQYLVEEVKCDVGENDYSHANTVIQVSMCDVIVQFTQL